MSILSKVKNVVISRLAEPSSAAAIGTMLLAVDKVVDSDLTRVVGTAVVDSSTGGSATVIMAVVAALFAFFKSEKK